jgi:hypothetical protein
MWTQKPAPKHDGNSLGMLVNKRPMFIVVVKMTMFVFGRELNHLKSG